MFIVFTLVDSPGEIRDWNRPDLVSGTVSQCPKLFLQSLMRTIVKH